MPPVMGRSNTTLGGGKSKCATERNFKDRSQNVRGKSMKILPTIEPCSLHRCPLKTRHQPV